MKSNVIQFPFKPKRSVSLVTFEEYAQIECLPNREYVDINVFDTTIVAVAIDNNYFIPYTFAKILLTELVRNG